MYFLELLCYNKITIKIKHISEKEKQNVKSQILLFNYKKGYCTKKTCPLYSYCLTQKRESYTCDYMVRLYNANLLLAPEYLMGEIK